MKPHEEKIKLILTTDHFFQFPIKEIQDRFATLLRILLTPQSV